MIFPNEKLSCASEEAKNVVSKCLPNRDNVGLASPLAGEGSIGEDLPGVPVDYVQSLHLQYSTSTET